MVRKFGDCVTGVLAPVLPMTHGFSMTSHCRVNKGSGTFGHRAGHFTDTIPQPLWRPFTRALWDGAFARIRETALRAGLVGPPLEAVDSRVVGLDGRIVRDSWVGELQVQGPPN